MRNNGGDGVELTEQSHPDEGQEDAEITVREQPTEDAETQHNDAAPLLYAPGDDGVLDLTEGTASTLTRRGAAQRKDVDFV